LEDYPLSDILSCLFIILPATLHPGVRFFYPPRRVEGKQLDMQPSLTLM